MKASDYVAQWLKTKVDFVFGVTGGAAVHLFDSCHQIGPTPIYCHHEQAAGFAAVAYARIKGFGVCITTTGPAASNALTPLLGAWQDSIPVLFISGQARSTQLSYYTQKRQVGSQEAPMISVVNKIANYSAFVDKPEFLKQMLESAYACAMNGRQGPAWLEICVDIQWQNV